MADYSTTAASVLASGTAQKVRTGLAGETIVAGQPLYIDSADGDSLKLARATSAKYQCVGISTSGAADGQPVAYVSADVAFVFGATLAIGDVVVVSATAGKFAPYGDLVSGDYVCILGAAISTTALNFNAASALRSDGAIPA